MVPGALTALVNSVVISHPLRRPCRQRSLCALPRPQLLGLSGNFLLQTLQEGFKPLVGSRTQASSHCRVPLSFNEWMPVELLELPPSSKQRHQDFPWRLTSELPPPQLGDPAHPQLMALRSQHCPESSLQMEKPHPPLDTRAYRFIFSFRVTFTYLT